MNDKDLVRSVPNLAVQYLLIYVHQWRGRKSRTTNAQKERVAEILAFCDTYFDMLSQENYKGEAMRPLLKRVLGRVQDDISIDMTDESAKLSDLLGRDAMLEQEDLIKTEMDKQERREREAALIDSILEKKKNRKL